MADVQLLIDDPTCLLTLSAMLEAEGHRIVGQAPQVVIADDIEKAIELAQSAPTIVLATASRVRDAVEAMRKGVYGYIFLPFQPGEAAMMVERASAQSGGVFGRDEPLMTLEEVENRHILATLRRCRYDRTRTARELGIGRNTLWRKLRKLQRARPTGRE